MTAVYFFGLFVGLGAWLPCPTAKRTAWAGFLFLQAWLLMLVVLYAGSVVLGVPLSRLLAVLALLAAGGLVFRFLRERPDAATLLRHTVHPIWVLTTLGLIVVAMHGGVTYLPYPGDEVASWLKLARQIFLIDAYWSNRVDYHLGAYTDGWPILVAFANTMHGYYDESHAALLQFLMHVGVLGATYDVVRHIVQREGLLKPRTGKIVAWVTVLGLLAIEASWILFPTFQLIEKPLLYTVLAGFLAILLALYVEESTRLLAAYLGLALAAGYLMKLAMIAFVPAALIFWAVLIVRDAGGRLRLAAGVRNAAVLACTMFGPLLAVAISWSFYKIGSNCTASPVRLLFEPTGPAIDRPFAIAAMFRDAAMSYFTSYKVPATLLGLAGLALALFQPRARWLVFAYAAFAIAYLFALFVSYLTCIDAINLGGLEGFQRYSRIILRLVHFLGPICLVLMALGNRRIRTGVDKLLSHTSGMVSAAVAIALLLAWQIRSVDMALEDMATRTQQDPVVRASILDMKTQSESLIDLVHKRGLTAPRVSIVAQNGYNVEMELGTYFGIKSVDDGGPLFHYKPVSPYFWSDRPRPFAAVTTQDTLESQWREFDIIWPVRTDEWTRAVLARLVSDAECAGHPERFFLIRSSGGFDCVAKAG